MIFMLICLLSGLSVVSCDTLTSKKVLSTRYPEKSPRVYIKDFFEMHPTATTKVKSFCPFHIFLRYIYFFLHSLIPHLRGGFRWIMCQTMSEESNQVMQINMYSLMSLLQTRLELKLFF